MIRPYIQRSTFSALTSIPAPTDPQRASWMSKWQWQCMKTLWSTMKDLLLLTLCPPLTIILTNCPPPHTSGFTFTNRQRLRYTGTISLLVDNKLRAGPTGSLFVSGSDIWSTVSNDRRDKTLHHTCFTRRFWVIFGYSCLLITVFSIWWSFSTKTHLVSVQKTSCVGLKYKFFSTNMATF